MLETIFGNDPSRIAIDDGVRRLTYAELGGLISAEAAWLAGSGARRVALRADNGCGWVIADLALHAARVPVVPLPEFFTAAQSLHALQDAGVDACLTDAPERLLEACPDFHASGRSPRTGMTLLQRALDRDAAPPLPAGATKITYTSGSTATPKGVCLAGSDLEIVARSLAAATRSAAVGTHLCLLPLATLLENVAGVYAPLLRGATCVVPSTRASGMSYGGLDPARLLAGISATRPDSLILVPELLRLLIEAADRDWRSPDSLKFIAVGGASVSRELLARAEAHGLPVFEGYGLSECASVVTLNTPESRRPGSAGRPLPHCTVRVAAGGELQVSGVSLRGYLGGPMREPGEPIATGDLGEIDADGFVYVRGRLGSVFITSLGRNISPEWVERELLAEPGIAQAMVHGEARPYPVALLAAPAAVALEPLVAAANRRLPDYARVRRWARLDAPLSVDDGLLTSNGRLRRAAIQERYGDLLESLYRDALAS